MDFSGPDQLPFLNLNWDKSMGPRGHLDSALSSMVSSPASNSLAGDNFGIHNLIGGGANGEISPQSHYMGGNALNSPPKLNLSTITHFHHLPQPPPQATFPVLENLIHLDQFDADPGFLERAVRFSNFGGGHFTSLGVSEQPHGSHMVANAVKSSDLDVGNGLDESSVSDPVAGNGEFCTKRPLLPEGNAKKRKATPKGKSKESSLDYAVKCPDKPLEEFDAKRSRSSGSHGNAEDAVKPKNEQNGSVSNEESGGKKNGKDSNSKPLDPPKDYIHVRARRGEATDSHSLAERVRREKISQRMKLLQDLVPGCNKVVGKAVMLDEIINYVQSLQRQVEFLSMKLATVNPQLVVDSLPNLLPKDMYQTCGPTQNPAFPLETSGAAAQYVSQHQQGHPLSCITNGMKSENAMHSLDSAFSRNIVTHHHFHNSSDASHQIGSFWPDDLQNVVPLDIGQCPDLPVSSQSFNGQLQTLHMKMEL